MITKKQLKNITMMTANEEWNTLKWFLESGVPKDIRSFLKERTTGKFNGDIIIAMKEMMDAANNSEEVQES